MPDWEAVAGARQGLVVCDATVSTPVYLKALDQGAEVVIHSATKFLTGSHNALLGATVTRDPERTATHLRDIRAGPHRDQQRLAALDGLVARRARLAAAPHDAQITASGGELANVLVTGVGTARLHGGVDPPSTTIRRWRSPHPRSSALATNWRNPPGDGERHRWRGVIDPTATVRRPVGSKTSTNSRRT